MEYLKKLVIGIICGTFYYVFMFTLFYYTVSETLCVVKMNNNLCELNLVDGGCNTVIRDRDLCIEKDGNFIKCIILRQYYIDMCKLYVDRLDMHKDVMDGLLF